MRATVLVRPKQGILDPQGQAVQASLEKLGFPSRRGPGRARDRSRGRGERCGRRAQRSSSSCAIPAREPADRELRGQAREEMNDRPVVAIIQFPGSNDDRDAAWALGALGAEAVTVWHGDLELPRRRVRSSSPAASPTATICGAGRSRARRPSCRLSGDSRRPGARSSESATGSRSSVRHGSLPGALRPNHQLEFVCRDVGLRVESTDSIFMRRCEVGQELVIPVKHGEGAWYADEGLFVQLAARRPDRPALHGGRERLARERRRRRERERERHGPHAASRACRRLPARLGGRSAPARRARRCRRRTDARSRRRCRPRRGRGRHVADERTAATRSPRGRSVRRSFQRARTSSNRSRRRSHPEHLAEDGRTLERRPQPLEIARPHRHGAAPRGPVGRVREANEPLAAPGSRAAAPRPRTVCPLRAAGR